MAAAVQGARRAEERRPDPPAERPCPFSTRRPASSNAAAATSGEWDRRTVHRASLARRQSRPTTRQSIGASTTPTARRRPTDPTHIAGLDLTVSHALASQDARSTPTATPATSVCAAIPSVVACPRAPFAVADGLLVVDGDPVGARGDARGQDEHPVREERALARHPRNGRGDLRRRTVWVPRSAVRRVARRGSDRRAQHESRERSPKGGPAHDRKHASSTFDGGVGVARQ